MADTSARPRRVWNLGAEMRFPIRAADSANVPVPLLPGYPKYAFVSPSGLQVQTGTASPTAVPGNYEVVYTLPLQSETSTPEMPWRLELVLVSESRHERTIEIDFDVVNKAVDSQPKRDVIEAHLEGRSYRAVWRGDAEPDDLLLECYCTRTPDDASRSPIPVALSKSSLTRSVAGTDVVYYYDIPASAFVPGTQSMFQNQFTLLWQTRESVASEVMTEYQQIRVVKRAGFELITGVRFMVDRFQHRFGTAYHISDGDICEALQQGLGLLNQWHPVSSPPYTDTTMPEAFRTFWVMLSSWWMLRSQHMLAGTLAFNFCVESNTWVRTDRGVYKIKHLHDPMLGADIDSSVGDVSELAAELEQLGELDFEKLQQDLEQVMHVDLLETRTEHLFPSRRLATPLGDTTATALWDLGHRDVFRLRTRGGYEITGTHNHPVLVLDKELEYRQVFLHDVKPGDHVALYAKAEPDTAYDLDISRAVYAATNDVEPENRLQFPITTTPELCRFLAYIVVSGYDVNPDHTQDFRFCFRDCFGIDLETAVPEQMAQIGRYITALGAYVPGNTNVPWVILAAPKPHAIEFIVTVFECSGLYVFGDTGVIPGVPQDSNGAAFLNLSNRMRLDMQQLLLRFGVVSISTGVGPGSYTSLFLNTTNTERYSRRIGFRRRGVDHLHMSPSYTLEPLPGVVMDYIRDAFDIDDIDSYDELKEFLDYFEPRIKDNTEHGLALERIRRLRLVIESEFVWLPVLDVVAAGTAHVYDPQLPVVQLEDGTRNPMSNLFYTNGLVTHNSGQSITLDQDITGAIDSAIQGLVDWLNQHLTPAKTSLFRQASRAGSVAVRPSRIANPNNRVYRIDSTGPNGGMMGGNSSLLSVAQTIGLLG